MPPSRDQQPARRRSPAAFPSAAAAAAPSGAPPPAAAAGAAGHRAPGRQPYAPFSVEAAANGGGGGGKRSPSSAPASSGVVTLEDAVSSIPATLQRLVDKVVRPRKEKQDSEKEEHPDAAALLAASSSELALLGPGGGGGGGGAPSALTLANGSGDWHAEAGGEGDEQAHPHGAARRVAFETVVAVDDGGTVPLRTESANDRSHFVRGVGPVERKMDGLKQYQAPWGYQLLERLTPRGRGFSLQVSVALARPRPTLLPLHSAALLPLPCCCRPAAAAPRQAAALGSRGDGVLGVFGRRAGRPPRPRAAPCTRRRSRLPTRPPRALSLTPDPFPPQTNRLIVLGLTFLCYTAYHASRKPPSIVKSVLHGDASNGAPGGAGSGRGGRQGGRLLLLRRLLRLAGRLHAAPRLAMVCRAGPGGQRSGEGAPGSCPAHPPLLVPCLPASPLTAHPASLPPCQKQRWTWRAAGPRAAPWAAAGRPSTTSATARRCWGSWIWPSWGRTHVSRGPAAGAGRPGARGRRLRGRGEGCCRGGGGFQAMGQPWASLCACGPHVPGGLGVWQAPASGAPQLQQRPCNSALAATARAARARPAPVSPSRPLPGCPRPSSPLPSHKQQTTNNKLAPPLPSHTHRSRHVCERAPGRPGGPASLPDWRHAGQRRVRGAVWRRLLLEHPLHALLHSGAGGGR